MKENTQEKKQLRPLSDILYSFFNTYLEGSDQGFGIKLWQNWQKFATTDILKEIINRTKPLSYQNGRLILWVAHSVELQELSFYMEDLKQEINKYFRKEWITDIYFTVNRDSLKKRAKTLKLLQTIKKPIRATN